MILWDSRSQNNTGTKNILHNTRVVPIYYFFNFLSQSYRIQLSPYTVIVSKKNAVASIYSYNAWNYFALQYLSSKSSITCWRMLFGLAACQAVKSVQLTLNRHPPRLGIVSIKLKHSSTEVKSRSLDCINKAYLGDRVNFVAFGFIVHSIRAKLNPVNLPLRPPLQN